MEEKCFETKQYLINGNIIPMDGKKRFSAILAKKGKIVSVGNDDEISREAEREIL